MKKLLILLPAALLCGSYAGAHADDAVIYATLDPPARSLPVSAPPLVIPPLDIPRISTPPLDRPPLVVPSLATDDDRRREEWDRRRHEAWERRRHEEWERHHDHDDHDGRDNRDRNDDRQAGNANPPAGPNVKPNAPARPVLAAARK